MKACIKDYFTQLKLSIIWWGLVYTKLPHFCAMTKTRAPHAVPTLFCRKPSFHLKFLVKKGLSSKNIAFRVMSLVLQLHLVMVTKFGVDTFNSFWVMGYIKVFVHCRCQRQQQQSSDHNSLTFSLKQMS